MKQIKSYGLFLLTFALLSSGILSCGSSGGSGPAPGPTPDPGPNPTCSSTQRTLTVTNSTNEQIWLGVTGGSLPCFTDSDCPAGTVNSCAGADASTQKAGHCSCTSNSQCGSQATCNTTNNICYMALPDLHTSQVNIAAGSHSTICIPAPVSGQPFQWSGNMFARTGCDSNGQHCQTGDCNAGSDGLCPAGTGGVPPTTLAEFTLSNQSASGAGPDYYDISIINGINVGVSMAPVSGTYTATAGNPYSCAAPGSTTASTGLSACTWTIDPTVPSASPTNQSSLLQDVSPVTATTCNVSMTDANYCTCSSDSDCTGGTVCGLATNADSHYQYAKVCGNHIGWWTADQVCLSAAGSALPSPDIAAFNCSSTNNQLYSCSGANAQSCYNDTSNATCCGCATESSNPYYSEWSTLPTAFDCHSNNTDWATIAQPWIVFLKQTCPTAYTYPFDDATSTFTCNGTGKNNPPNYNITFLPTN